MHPSSAADLNRRQQVNTPGSANSDSEEEGLFDGENGRVLIGVLTAVLTAFTIFILLLLVCWIRKRKRRARRRAANATSFNASVDKNREKRARKKKYRNSNARPASEDSTGQSGNRQGRQRSLSTSDVSPPIPHSRPPIQQFMSEVNRLDSIDVPRTYLSRTPSGRHLLTSAKQDTPQSKRTQILQQASSANPSSQLLPDQATAPGESPLPRVQSVSPFPNFTEYGVGHSNDSMTQDRNTTNRLRTRLASENIAGTRRDGPSRPTRGMQRALSYSSSTAYHSRGQEWPSQTQAAQRDSHARNRSSGTMFSDLTTLSSGTHFAPVSFGDDEDDTEHGKIHVAHRRTLSSPRASLHDLRASTSRDRGAGEQYPPSLAYTNDTTLSDAPMQNAQMERRGSPAALHGMLKTVSSQPVRVQGGPADESRPFSHVASSHSSMGSDGAMSAAFPFPPGTSRPTSMLLLAESTQSKADTGHDKQDAPGESRIAESAGVDGSAGKKRKPKRRTSGPLPEVLFGKTDSILSTTDSHAASEATHEGGEHGGRPSSSASRRRGDASSQEELASSDRASHRGVQSSEGGYLGRSDSPAPRPSSSPFLDPPSPIYEQQLRDMRDGVKRQIPGYSPMGSESGELGFAL